MSHIMNLDIQPEDPSSMFNTTSIEPRGPDSRKLFTPSSNFPFLQLPPLGATPRNLDFVETDPQERIHHIGEQVWARCIDVRNRLWRGWYQGNVVAVHKARTYLGSFARMYVVRSRCLHTGQEWRSCHFPFLYEIQPFSEKAPDLKVSIDKCLERLSKTKNVYAPILHETRRTSEAESEATKLELVWVPCQLLKWEQQTGEKDLLIVEGLAGPYKKKKFHVSHALPCTLGTAYGCKSQGSYVITLDGEIH
ncbi:hypothetical protein D9758_002953 [Tetrapyrgos nigripes]|uniref:Uncharacterized protein n=1 Tax=Tetrapyrgos nigripes TaxID=182062 RepID=A0A8H5LSZ7_9AGAR|nr:hypothetical protein D9758_002953 [Tetrapyrgos nigripes]